MTTPGPASAHEAIDRLLRRYADIATRRAWDELVEIVAADARVVFTFSGSEAADVTVTGPTGLARFGREALQGFSFYLYTPLNNVADLAQDATTARGRAYALETAIADSSWLDIYGRYDDEYSLHDGRWMIASRHYQELARRTLEI